MINEEVRQQFDLTFKRFAKQMGVALPDIGAKPYIADLKLWDKVQHGARNTGEERDERLELRRLFGRTKGESADKYFPRIAPTKSS